MIGRITMACSRSDCLVDGAEAAAAEKVTVEEAGGGGLQHGYVDEDPPRRSGASPRRMRYASSPWQFP